MFSECYLFEEWRPVVGYEGLYEVSNFGRVRSLNYRQKIGKIGILNFSKHRNGYLQADLYKNKKKKKFTVHRLVATAFIPNPNNYPCINHKNRNRSDNKVCNLEWCTYKYNNNYGGAVETRSKLINQYSLNNDFIKQWPSTMEIERELGYNHSNISACCLGKRKYKTAYGYIWRYA